jgi:hypothetical protein
MSPRLTPEQRETVVWLRSLGIAITRWRRGRGSHLVVYLRFPRGRETVSVLQLAAGDWRGSKNYRAQILRDLRLDSDPVGERSTGISGELRATR